MAAGFGLLRLSPETFWSMTPRELSVGLRSLGGIVDGGMPSRRELETLMRAFPDNTQRVMNAGARNG